MMTLRIRSLVLFAAVAVTITACKKKPAEPPAPTPSTTRDNPPPVAPPVTTQPNNPPATTNNDASAEATRRAIEAAKATLIATIYFDYDRSDLLPDAQRTLNEKVPLMKSNMAVRLRIVGHTDERGSDEYNQALGQRRAAAARTFLVAQGIAGDRIDVVSMGESQPAMMGEGEASWSKNRRDEFQIVAGAESIRAPGR
jgi:peptidoglycan-associated lipoprotein